jgi:hypothetical protein
MLENLIGGGDSVASLEPVTTSRPPGHAQRRCRLRDRGTWRPTCSCAHPRARSVSVAGLRCDLLVLLGPGWVELPRG